MASAICLPQIIYQDYVSVFGAARERELFPIARPVEREDEVGLKIRQLRRRSAVNGLKPDVGDAAARADVGEGAPIRQPSDRRDGGTGELRLIKELHRLSPFKREERNL